MIYLILPLENVKNGDYLITCLKIVIQPLISQFHDGFAWHLVWDTPFQFDMNSRCVWTSVTFNREPDVEFNPFDFGVQYPIFRQTHLESCWLVVKIPIRILLTNPP